MIAVSASVVSPAVADLLHRSARRLGYQQMVRVLGAWGWITAATGIAQAALYIFYRPVAPAYFVALSALALAGACGYCLSRRPSRLAAARFADEHLGGGCAYRTVLETATTGKFQEAAVARLIEWLKGHEPTARHTLQALPAVRWPEAALASALVSMAVSLTLVHIPGAAAHGADPVEAAAAGSLATIPGGIGEPTASVSRPPSSVPQPPRAGARRTATGGASSALASQQTAGREAPAHRGMSRSPDDAADRSGGQGLLAGAAHDAELAARLAQTVQFAAIERYGRERPGDEMEGQHAGAAFEPDLGPGAPAGLTDRRDVAGSGRAALRPRQVLEWAPPRPAARVLVSRYLSERDR